MKTLDKLILKKNKETILFTPGPGSLLKENISGIRPCFGRNDNIYSKIEKYVLNKTYFGGTGFYGQNIF